MNTLVGRKFSYLYRGKEVIRKVLSIIRGEGEPVYKLLNPVTHERHEAYVEMFNRMFKTNGRVKIDKTKINKGKTIRGKQNIFE